MLRRWLLQLMLSEWEGILLVVLLHALLGIALVYALSSSLTHTYTLFANGRMHFIYVHVFMHRLLCICQCIHVNCCQFESSSFCGFYTLCGCSAEGWSTSIIVCQGLGSPVFDKLEAELAKAMMSLPATKGFEFGSGFAGWEFICYFVFIGLLL